MSASLAHTSHDRFVRAGFLALGSFAIGTEGFMIAPLLPVMAEDFRMAVPAVAQVFAVAP